MITKPQNLLRSLLLIPYFAWGAGLAFLLLADWLAKEAVASNVVFEALVGFVSFYTIGIIVWGIPYTILAVGLWLWSIKKPAPVIYKVFASSPLFLAILMLVETALISFWPQDTLFPTSFKEFLSYALVTVVPALVIGYVFVGGGALLYRLMRTIIPLGMERETE